MCRLSSACIGGHACTGSPIKRDRQPRRRAIYLVRRIFVYKPDRGPTVAARFFAGLSPGPAARPPSQGLDETSGDKAKGPNRSLKRPEIDAAKKRHRPLSIFSAPRITTTLATHIYSYLTGFTCVCVSVYPADCDTDGDQVSPEKGKVPLLLVHVIPYGLCVRRMTLDVALVFVTFCWGASILVHERVSSSQSAWIGWVSRCTRSLYEFLTFSPPLL